jgi:geranylgeranyl reductase family protein
MAKTGGFQVNRPKDLDVLIVGGGPVGGIVAEGIARNHLSTMILEEHKNIGQPEHCAGLISLDGFRKLGIMPPKHLVLNEVRGAAIFSPSGENLTVERSNAQAFVMDRISLDRYLVGNATLSGSELQLKTKAKRVAIKPDGAIVTAETRNSKNEKNEITLRSKLIISAEGAQAKLTNQVGLDVPNPKMKLYATQFEMSNVRLERDDLVEIYFGSFAPGFFAWVIPTGRDSARIGLASNVAKSYTLLKYFVSHHPVAAHKLAKASLEKVFGGTVLTGGPSKATSSDRFLAVGDCTGQTKPTTGGGVITGGLCAKIASRVAVESVALGEFTRKFLGRYDRIWRSQLGQEFFSMLQLRKALNLLPNSLLDKALVAARRSGLEKVIEEKGDIDAQSQLIRSVMMNPRIIISFVLSFLGL